MAHPRKRPSLTVLLYVGVMVTLGGYFTFASVQGEYGLFRRLQIEAELSELQAVSGKLDEELAVMRNKTLRLSDSYLDLDLLDEQARDVLGYLRADEIVIR
ncbi:MAG: septum formation initiator family protein [Rhodobacteraceae bacterium]|uniref:FtsB family cell division protein n=1 Tax=Celeribacter TaxID=875170 RepID=UPI001431BD4E|nr:MULTISPECIES: septum formation initiator family protein [Celeribacter]NIY78950.1 septum formation initiator family protein [Celeribacter sp. HF31]NVK47727.1 septum formation initiator family protein [Paracoccaceae bacterium]